MISIVEVEGLHAPTRLLISLPTLIFNRKALNMNNKLNVTSCWMQL
jgi:hypothetical protein